MCVCEQRNGSELSSLDDCDGDDDADSFRLADSDADDEFECDCPICLMHQQHISGICNVPVLVGAVLAKPERIAITPSGKLWQKNAKIVALITKNMAKLQRLSC